MENGSTNTTKNENALQHPVSTLESYIKYSILEVSFIPKAHGVNDGSIEANKIASARNFTQLTCSSTEKTSNNDYRSLFKSPNDGKC